MTGAVEIDRADVAAADLLTALHGVTADAAWDESPWTAATWRSMLSLAGVFALLAVDAGCIGAERDPVGFALGQIAGDDVEILAIGVRPDKRRQGIGRRLLDALATAAREAGMTGMVLEVAEANRAARALYTSAGFHVVGRRRAYYRTAEGRFDAVILRGPVSGSQSSRSS